MRCFLLISILFVEILAESETNGTSEFVPIGKDSSPRTIGLEVERPLPKSVGSVVSHKVFTEDGIKYTEIVRKTPSGGTQTAHIEGAVKPSLLPVPVPDFSGIMRRLQTTLARRLEVEPSPPSSEFISSTRTEFIPPRSPLRTIQPHGDGPIYHRSEGFVPPPAYPPMMMYPPTPYGLLGRVGSMTDGILDNVMDFVIGRRR